MFTGEDGGSVQNPAAIRSRHPDKQKVDGNVYSAAKPGFFRIYRYEMAADVVRGASGGAERLPKIFLEGDRRQDRHTARRLRAADQRDLGAMVCAPDFPAWIMRRAGLR